jgi:fructoselysine-6-P-deglycase FrlB-like protein
MVSLDGKERERAFQPLLEFLLFMFMVFLDLGRQDQLNLHLKQRPAGASDTVVVIDKSMGLATPSSELQKTLTSIILRIISSNTLSNSLFLGI